jgi:hypothetical protein
VLAIEFGQSALSVVCMGCAALALGVSALALLLVKHGRRLDAIERQIGLVPKMQRSDRVEPQQVVAKRSDST